MTPVQLSDGPDALSLDADEARAYVAERVERELHMSVDEFVRRAADGSLPAHPSVPHLVILTGASAEFC